MKSHGEVRDPLLARNLRAVHVKTDQLFFWLLIAQWLFAVVIAVAVSPYGWAGKVKTIHIHVEYAIVLGALINAFPLVLVRIRPGWWITRHAVAVAQMLW